MPLSAVQDQKDVSVCMMRISTSSTRNVRKEQLLYRFNRYRQNMQYIKDPQTCMFWGLDVWFQ